MAAAAQTPEHRCASLDLDSMPMIVVKPYAGPEGLVISVVALPKAGVSDVSTDISCAGCSSADTRAHVQSTSSADFVCFSALAAL